MALRLFQLTDSVTESANVHLDLGYFAACQGDIHRALTHAETAHRAYRSAGNRPGQAYAANNIGWYHRQLGNHAAGIPYCQEALDILLDIDEPDGAAGAWDSLGALYFGIGDRAQGEHCYQQAIALCRRLGDRYSEAATYTNLVHAHTGAGDHDAAHQARQQALAILDDLEPDAAAQIRARLSATS
jgi:tetratricopeptide (TPR) repeat protein